MNKQSKKENNFISFGSWNKKEKTVNETAKKIEAKETYLKIKKNISQMHKERINTSQSFGNIMLNPHNTPILVATPLPPLNFKKTGQTCPQTGKNAAKT